MPAPPVEPSSKFRSSKILSVPEGKIPLQVFVGDNDDDGRNEGWDENVGLDVGKEVLGK